MSAMQHTSENTCSVETCLKYACTCITQCWQHCFGIVVSIFVIFTWITNLMYSRHTDFITTSNLASSTDHICSELSSLDQRSLIGRERIEQQQSTNTEAWIQSVTSLVPRPPPFLPSVCAHSNTQQWKTTSVYYCEHKWKVQNRGGLGMRLECDNGETV